MKNDLTEIVCIIDRSGSMESTKDAAEEGFNGFLNSQREQPGEARITLVQFDDRYEKIYDNAELKNIKNYQLSPRGSTALLSAIKRTVREVGERLAATHEDLRPSKVIVVIVTDGQENSSRYSLWEPVESYNEIAKIISHQRERYSWSFQFLGANQDAIATASNLGILSGSALTYAANAQGTRASYESLARGVNDLRSMDHALFASNVAQGKTFCQADRDAQTEAGL